MSSLESYRKQAERAKPITHDWIQFFGWAVMLLAFAPMIIFGLIKIAIPIQWLIYIALAIIIVTLIVAGVNFRKDLDVYERYADDRLKEIKKFETEIAQLKQDLQHSKHNEERHIKIADDIIAADPLKAIASYFADYTMLVHDIDEYNLRHKTRPAFKGAEAVAEIKRHAKEEISKLKEAEYKIQFLLDAFPDLSIYIENYADLKMLSDYNSISEFEEERDRVRDFLTQEEWNSLSTTDKNQLALDRYVARQKSNWQIGRDYEMCCAWHLEQNAYKVIRFGIENGVHDLGRDLIARKSLPNGSTQILIIQCKFWSHEREIRENVIAQLYGTYFAYLKEHNIETSNSRISVYPVIMFPHFSKLSYVAEQFCKKLGILIRPTEYVDYPRIKCNVNGGNKIYHLPFDQQYDRTMICNKGEFYAWNVKEAESKGFRRAMRHQYQSF